MAVEALSPAPRPVVSLATVAGLSIVNDEAAWKAVLAETGASALQLRWSYCRAAAMLETDGWPELAVWRDSRGAVLHPYIRRAVPDAPGLTDLISPFEFGGFWFTGEGDPEALFAAFDMAHERQCAMRDTVSAFVRFHPFQPLPDAVARAYGAAVHCDNVTVDLRRPYEAVLAGFHPSRRKQIRQARRHGLTATWGDDIERFLTVYHASLDRLGARPFYYFPAAFLEALEPCLRFLFVHDAAGELCAAHCYMIDGEVVHAFLCHGVAEKQGLRPNDFGYDVAIRGAIGEGYEALHLGGGAPSLYAYKRTFSESTRPYLTGRRIYRTDLYAALVECRERELGRSLAESAYFPRYATPF